MKVCNPGQFTDDTQIMILVATLLADGKYNEERYTAALRELYSRGALRFPDGSVSAVCEHTVQEHVPRKGVKSTTAGLPSPCSPLCPCFSGYERSLRTGGPGMQCHAYPSRGTCSGINVCHPPVPYASRNLRIPLERHWQRHRSRMKCLAARYAMRWRWRRTGWKQRPPFSR